jgi:hypothetical protein
VLPSGRGVKGVMSFTDLALLRPPSHQPRVHSPAIRGPLCRRPLVTRPELLRPAGRARAALLPDLRGHQRGHRRPRRTARPPECCACAARPPRPVLVPHRRRTAGPSTGQPETGYAGRSCSTAATPGRTSTRPPDACTGSPRGPASRSQRTPARAPPHVRRDHARRRRGPARCSDRPRHTDPRTTMRSVPPEPGRHPSYILAAFMAPGTRPAHVPAARPGPQEHPALPM